MEPGCSSGHHVSPAPPPTPETTLVQQEKCYDPDDPTMRFVDGGDDLDFEYIGYKSRRATMSCGHAVTPMSLTKYCRWLLEEGRRRFMCPVYDCETEWSYAEVLKMALLTPEEQLYFRKKMAYLAKSFAFTKSCPGCLSSMRKRSPNLRTRCRVCSAAKKKSYYFCWQCLREWKGPYPQSERCLNDGCVNQDLEILKNCKEVEFRDMKTVSGCPSVRACPTCGLMVVHNLQNCKQISCPRCRQKFCFVCLKVRECFSGYGACVSGIAPRQTSIPRRQRRQPTHISLLSVPNTG